MKTQTQKRKVTNYKHVADKHDAHACKQKQETPFVPPSLFYRQSDNQRHRDTPRDTPKEVKTKRHAQKTA